MKPEAQAHLDKAAKCLIKARAELAVVSTEVSLAEDAARNAYYAAFHAAQALIFERVGKTRKTHSGVQIEFHRLAKDDVAIDASLKIFLSKAYDFKAVDDYDTGSAGDITPRAAALAIASAESFVAVIAGLLAAP